MNLKCLVGLHDNEVVAEAYGNVNACIYTFGVAGQVNKIRGLTTLYKCRRCEKEKAVVVLENGNEGTMNPQLVRYKMREAGIL